MQPQKRLLFDIFDRYKPHVWPANRFADCLGIRCIVFIGFHVRLDELRRNELHRVPKLRKLARPEMRTAAGLHPNEARRQISEEYSYLRTLQLLAQCDLASRIDPMYLEN